jgi:predicted DNA binding CopG/RHH family protein
MRATKREERVTVRLAGPLLYELSTEAAQDGRPLASLVRRILVDAMAECVVQRQQRAT